jgi:serine protease AprX
MKIIIPNLCALIAFIMVVPIFSSTNLIMVDASTTETTEFLIFKPNNNELLSNLQITCIEEYSDFILVEITAFQKELLIRNGVRAVEIKEQSFVHVNGYKFDIKEGEPTLSPNETINGYDPYTDGLYIVHLIGPVKDKWINMIQETGADVINYMPNYAFEVRMTPEEKINLEGLSFVDGIAFYHPAYKISQELGSTGLSITLMNSITNVETISTISEMADILSISSTSFGHLIVISKTDDSTIRSIAILPDVQFIGPHHENALTDEVGMQIDGGYCWFNDPDGNPSTPYRATGNYGAYVNHLGWTGAGVTVAIADSGIGNGSIGNAGHNDFTGRVIGGMAVGGGSFADGYGHGTHCAGLLAGDTYNGNGVTYAGHGPYYVGMGLAYNAKLYSEKIFDNSGDWIGADFGDIQQWGYAGGGRIHTNSWGESAANGQYDERDEAYDQRVRDADDEASGNQQLITFVSAGNYGPSSPSVTGPATGKNVISVGSVENYMPDTDSYGNNFDIGTDANNPDQISDFSSRGTTDNRIKPDIMAPGQAILSLRSPVAPPNCLYGAYTEDDRYVWCSGTSMSCPTAAGGGALIYEWHQANYGTPPTPAMVKALLVNTALNIGPVDCPNDEYGWGRMYLPTIMDPPAPFMLYDTEPELTTGEIHEFNFTYSDGAEPIKITLAYTDKNALNGDNPTLKNQVNIEVESPSGDIYHGNAFVGGWTPANTEPDLGWDDNQDGYDDRNNVESVFIPFQSLEAGTYTLRVIGFNVPEDCDNDGSLDQDYSLVMYNVDISKGRIDLDKDRYPIEDIARVEVRDMDLDTDGTQQNVIVTVDSSTEPTGESVILTETGGSTGIFVSTLPLSATNGVGVLWVSHGDTITATYNDADDGTGSPAVVTDTATVDDKAPNAPTMLTVDWWGHTNIILLEENFTGSYPPPGWAENDPFGRWNQNFGNESGGESPEARFEFMATTNLWRLYAGPIDTGGLTEIKLQWNNFNDELGPGTDCKIQTSSDGSSWTDTSWIWTSGSGDRGPRLENITINTPDVGSGTFYVGWTVDGNGANINSWYIDDVLLNYSGPYTNDNWLNWTLSPDDGAGDNDVIFYNIYRSVNQFGPWDGSAYIDSVFAGMDSYIDPGCGEVDGIHWWYIVRAEDTVGNEETNVNAVPEPAVPTFNIPVIVDWNFISSPLIPSNISVPNVLLDLDSDTTWTILQYYDAADGTDPWKTYCSLKPASLNDLDVVNNTMGIWLYIPDVGSLGDGFIKVTGAQPTTTNINLWAGWNLIGYPSLTERNISDALAGTGYDRPVEGFNATAPYRLSPLADTYSMKPSEGYWVHVPVDTIWNVIW